MDGIADEERSIKLRSQMLDRYDGAILDARGALISISPMVPEAVQLAVDVVGLSDPDRNRAAVEVLRPKL